MRRKLNNNSIILIVVIALFTLLSYSFDQLVIRNEDKLRNLQIKLDNLNTEIATYNSVDLQLITLSDLILTEYSNLRRSNKYWLKAILINTDHEKSNILLENNIKKCIAINEISILRQSRQTASLTISNGKKQIIKHLISDGVLVSTPAGSTAYNLSVHGPILSIDSNKLSISPISAFRPRRWKGKIVSDKSKIIIKNLNHIKRPISAVADNIEVRNAKSISIKTNKKIKFNLIIDKNRSLQKKIKIEQLRRETK